MSGLHAQRRGEHRVYLSLAPGIGATRRMLADAQQLVASGYNVGLTFRSQSDDLNDFTAGLRLVPMSQQRINSTMAEFFDLDAVLRDPPQFIVLGNLAYQTGLPKHPFEPLALIERLRQAGINVWSTVYAYNLTSIAPIYERLTDLNLDVVIEETVLEQASELILIDPEPAEILRLLDEGRLMSLAKAAIARQTIFRLDVLEQLRAAMHALLELRRPIVDDDTRPRLLVCIGFNPNAIYLVQRAADLAHGLGAVLVGLHVRPPGGGSSGYELTMREHLEIADELCHEIVVIEEKDVATALIEIAHECQASGIVIGRPVHSRWDELRGGSLLTKLINTDRDIDIFVLGDAPTTSH